MYPSTIILARNIFSSLDDLKIIQENEIQSMINIITHIPTVEEYKPRIIIFAFMKQMIYDYYKYVQVDY